MSASGSAQPASTSSAVQRRSPTVDDGARLRTDIPTRSASRARDITARANATAPPKPGPTLARRRNSPVERASAAPLAKAAAGQRSPAYPSDFAQSPARGPRAAQRRAPRLQPRRGRRRHGRLRSRRAHSVDIDAAVARHRCRTSGAARRPRATNSWPARPHHSQRAIRADRVFAKRMTRDRCPGHTREHFPGHEPAAASRLVRTATSASASAWRTAREAARRPDPFRRRRSSWSARARTLGGSRQ